MGSACLTLCMICVVIIAIAKTQGHIHFCKQFLTAFSIKKYVFLSTDNFDYSPSDVLYNNVTSLIRYDTNYDEFKVADQIEKLFIFGNITAVLFLDSGHGKLLKILIRDLKLFHKGLTGLIQEFDIAHELGMTLRLNTLLYVYTTNGSIIKLKEMYAINGKTIVNQVGIFKEEGGLSIPTPSMWDRRSNLEGMEIRVATVSYPYVHELYRDTLNTSISGGGGLFIEPLNILAPKLNFYLNFSSSIDGQWGININGTWNGLMGMLIKGQADIAAAGLSLTIERSKEITFGNGLDWEEFTLMSPQTTDHEFHVGHYLQIFPVAAWCLIGAMIFILSTCYATINSYGIDYMHDPNDSEPFTLINSIGLTLTFFRQNYYNVNIRGMSSKILFITSAMSTYLLYVHYTSYQVATSTTGIKESPIRSFRDVLSGGYQIFVVENTAAHSALRLAAPGTPMHDVYHNTMVDNPNTFLKSYKIISKITHAEKSLYYGSAFYMTILSNDLTFLDIKVLFQLNQFDCQHCMHLCITIRVIL